MSLSRKLGLSALLVSLLGAGAGVGVAFWHVGARSAVQAPNAEITQRTEHDAPEAETVMVSTRLPAAQPGTGARVGTSSSVPSSVEAQRLPSPSTMRAARSRSLDGSRDGEGLRVRRLVVSTGIESREPTGASDTFDGEDERLYAFVDLANRGDATEVEISFEPEIESRDAHVTGLVTLEVPSEVGRHRTWAWSRNVHTPGNWFAVVRDLEGHELAREAFTIE